MTRGRGRSGGDVDSLALDSFEDRNTSAFDLNRHMRATSRPSIVAGVAEHGYPFLYGSAIRHSIHVRRSERRHRWHQYHLIAQQHSIHAAGGRALQLQVVADCGS